MALPTEATYNDLNGNEAKLVLHARFWDLLQTIPEFQDRFALTRVVLRLEISMDIWGATSPRKIIQDKYEMKALTPPPEGFVPVDAHHHLTAEADSRKHPPDQIREEHGLPIPTTVRGPSGFLEDEYQPSPVPAKYPQPPQPVPAALPKPIPSALLPANQPNPNMKQFGKRMYAAFVEQDTRGEAPAVGGEKMATTRGGADHAPVQPDFRTADFRNLPADKVQQIVQETIERGHAVDQEWSHRPIPEDIPEEPTE